MEIKEILDTRSDMTCPSKIALVKPNLVATDTWVCSTETNAGPIVLLENGEESMNTNAICHALVTLINIVDLVTEILSSILIISKDRAKLKQTETRPLLQLTVNIRRIKMEKD